MQILLWPASLRELWWFAEEFLRMCGVVGLFAKNKKVEASFGRHLSTMLVELTDRGPDSTGVAVYRNPVQKGMAKVTLLAPMDSYDWSKLELLLRDSFGMDATLWAHGDHAVVRARGDAATLRHWLQGQDLPVHVNSSGTVIEIFKGKGLPQDVIDRFSLGSFTGTHALGHTRMATESAVTTEHSHPFSTGEDLCLVHNGSLSNHNSLRERLKKHGIHFSTDNDSEVAAGYLTWRLQEGDTLEEALEWALRELDGFFTFAIGTRDGFAVVRDPIACKPAVIAETDDWVAMASEYRAIATLPDADLAQCWEPAPGRVYTWSH